MPDADLQKPDWLLQMENILETLNEGAVMTDDALRVVKTLPEQSIAAMGKLETALNDTYVTARRPKDGHVA